MNFTYNFSLKSSLLPIEDKVRHRRKRILELRERGYTQVKISHDLKYSLSTIEKDIQKLKLEILN